MSTIRKTLTRTFIVAVALSAFAATGCNTVKGVGEDIQSVGEAGEQALSGD